MDGLARLEHICSSLQRSRIVINNEAELAVPQASLAMDEKHLEIRLQVHLYRTIHLDETSVCRVYDDRQVYQPFDTACWTGACFLLDLQEYD